MGAVQEQEGLEQALGVGWGTGGGGSSPSEGPGPFLICGLLGCQQWPPAPGSDAVQGPSRAHPSQPCAPLHRGSPHPGGEPRHGAREARVRGLLRPRSTLGQLGETSQSPEQLVSGVGKCVHAFYGCGLGSLQPHPCQSHWFSNQSRGLAFLRSNPRAGAPNVWFVALTPQGGSLSPCNSLPFRVPS